MKSRGNIETQRWIFYNYYLSEARSYRELKDLTFFKKVKACHLMHDFRPTKESHVEINSSLYSKIQRNVQTSNNGIITRSRFPYEVSNLQYCKYFTLNSSSRIFIESELIIRTFLQINSIYSTRKFSTLRIQSSRRKQVMVRAEQSLV